MRERLLDATFACLVDRGYRATALPEICRRAGVSRGAQLHHYATKESLVAAAVEHVLTRRLAELGEHLAHAPQGVLDLPQATAFLWRVYTGPAFYAWMELLVAARTDADLRRLVAKVDARFVARAERLCQQFLLPYVTDAGEVAATTRLILAIFDGLATHRILTGDDDTVAKSALAVAARAGLFAPKDRIA